MSSKATTTRRAINDLEKRGYTAANVEKWNSFAHIRQDLWGFADLIAFKPGEVLLVQTTTKSNMAARRTKINSNTTAQAWLQAGHAIELQGWYKEGRFWKVKTERLRETVHDVSPK